MGFWGKGKFFGQRGDARLIAAIGAEEQAGLAFAFKARTVAVILVAIWLPFVVQGPRTFYYLSFVAAFFLLGLVPHMLRRWRYADMVRLVFIFLDVVLISAVIIMQPPDNIAFDWPVQMRIRFVEFLYLNLLLIGAALSYRPSNVIWTGLCIIVVWSTGVLLLYNLPDTVRVTDTGADLTAAEVLAIVLDPRYVGISSLLTQNVLTAIATGLLAAAVARSRNMLLRQTRAEVARADLSRYVSPDVADAMLAGTSNTFGAPAIRHVAVLFADIWQFTTLVEKLEPERVVTLLRSFQARTTAIVFRHGGTLDKYLGDGFMATFGALESGNGTGEMAAQRALACALDLQREMDRWCDKRARRGAFSVRLGIGLHYGPAVVGNVGSDQRLEFTVVGDAANVAARIERLTREHDCRIAVSDACLSAARDAIPDLPAFTDLGPTTLRGRVEPVRLHIWPAPTTAA
nr:adenylate/guanylate cyclase domain-containing protein [uncultured Dongia sp.]